jgi:hypothetical protein
VPVSAEKGKKVISEDKRKEADKRDPEKGLPYFG